MRGAENRTLPPTAGRGLTARGTAGALLLFLAACQPFVLASGSAPASTAPNQLIALLAWSGVCLWAGASLRVAAVAPGGPAGAVGPTRAISAGILRPRIFIALGLAWAGSSSIAAGLPASLWIPLVGVPAAAWLCGEAGHRLAAVSHLRTGASLAFCTGLVTAGLLTSIAGLIQVLMPELADGRLIASPPGGGRAYGNLRQPNQMCTLVLWALVAAVTLREVMGAKRASEPEARRPTNLWLASSSLAGATLLTAWLLVLSGSRTGALATLILALWGALDRKLKTSSRWLLGATPAAYALCWLAMRQWSQTAGNAFGAERVVTQTTNISSGRFDIWANALDLIQANPWRGVGWGNFNFAWTLTPFPDRPKEFFDHAHNLPLQLAAELGLPAAAMVMAGLAWAIWRAWKAAAAAEPASSAAGRGFVVMLLVVGLHSLLEYPLWYAYFLLPAAFMLGFAAGLQDPGEAARVAAGHPAKAAFGQQGVALMAGGGLCLAGTLWASADYRSIGSIFAASGDAPPLSHRIEHGKQRLFFSHHAHYAAATVAPAGAGALGDFDIATRNLLDTRLMVAWSQALGRQGSVERSQYIAQRLQEFGVPDVPGLPSDCVAASAPMGGRSIASPPSRESENANCKSPAPVLAWRDFIPRQGP